MSTTYNHIQLGVVDDAGDVQVLYPQSTATDVSVDASNNSIPNGYKNLQSVLDIMGEMAFHNADDVVFFGESVDEQDVQDMGTSEINDDIESSSLTWSSAKIKSELNNLDSTFINNLDITLNDITKLFKINKTFCINASLTEFSTLEVPMDDHTKQYIVRYEPMNISVNALGERYVTTAHQEWITFDNTYTTLLTYHRFYAGGKWYDFFRK